MMNGKLSNIIEALLFAAAEPLSAKAICRVLDGVSTTQIAEAVDALNNRYYECESSLRVREVAGGYQLYSMPEYAQYIDNLLAKTKKQRLSRAALETLAVIAYRQPVTAPEIDAIRGVDSSGVLRKLLERNVIAITGRSEKPGRPLLYGTTKEFLYYFGLNDLKDLPRMAELETLLNRSREEVQLEFSAADQEPDTAGNGDQLEYHEVRAADLRPIAINRTVPKTANDEADRSPAEPESELEQDAIQITEQTPEMTFEPADDDPDMPTTEISRDPQADKEEEDSDEILKTARDVITSPAE